MLPLALAGFLWTGGHLLDVPLDHTSLVVLLVLGLIALAVPRPEVALTSTLAAGSGALGAIPQAADVSVSLAVHLTLAGALVTATALAHRDHRQVAWLGGLLLAAATWVRLYDIGVQAPEAYTLPTATALIALGLLRLRRSRELDTMSVLLPGLALAVTPTLLWALVQPLSTRAVVVGLAALGLVLAGSVLRWTAPVVVGWCAGLALVLRELAPYAAQTPQWVLIGSAGALLIVAGISWETQVRELRRAAGYLGRLR